MEFTCTPSESSPAAVRWTANGRPLYSFFIPNDLGTQRANQTSAGLPGIAGLLFNETTIKLLVDLSISTHIINGTQVLCSDLVV